VAAAASALALDAPTNVSAGIPFGVTVSARDPYRNLVTTYTGTITFASSDNGALLPDNYRTSWSPTSPAAFRAAPPSR
jgi:hypothetical protein